MRMRYILSTLLLLALCLPINASTVTGHIVDSRGNGYNGTVTFAPSNPNAMVYQGSTLVQPTTATGPVQGGNFSVGLVGTVYRMTLFGQAAPGVQPPVFVVVPNDNNTYDFSVLTTNVAIFTYYATNTIGPITQQVVPGSGIAFTTNNGVVQSVTINATGTGLTGTITNPIVSPSIIGTHIGNGSGLTNTSAVSMTGTVTNPIISPTVYVGSIAQFTNSALGGTGSKITFQGGASHQGDDYNVYTVPGNVIFNSPEYQWLDNNNNTEMTLIPKTGGNNVGLSTFLNIAALQGNIGITQSSNYFQGSAGFLTNNNLWPELAGRASLTPPLEYNVLHDIGVPGGVGGPTSAGCLGIAFSNGIVNLSTNGMYNAGWRWAIMDDGWAQTNRDVNNNLQVDPNFISGGSNGLVSIFTFSHGLGFSNILYTSYLDQQTAFTCSGRAGTPIQYVANDAGIMLRFGIDGYKVDQCVTADGTDFLRYWRFALDALPTAGFCSNYLYLITTDIENPNGAGTIGDDVQHMLLGNQPEYGQDYAQLTCSNLVRAAKHRLPWKDLVRPGHYFEVSAIGCFPGFGFQLDTNQTKNAITMNTMMAAAIVSSSSASNAAYAGLCTNTNWISIQQNPAVVCGYPVSSNNLTEIWLRPLGGGNLFGRWNVGQSNAVACFNYSGSSKSFSVNWTNLGLPNSTVMTVIDDWAGTSLGNFSGGFTVTEPTGTNALLFTLMPLQNVTPFDFSKNITSAQLICDYNFSAANLPTGSNIFNLVDQGKTGLIIATNNVSCTNAPYQSNNVALYNGSKFGYFTGQAGTGVGQPVANTSGLMFLAQPTTFFWVGTAPQNSGGTAYDGNTGGSSRQAVFFQSGTTTTMYAGSSLTATLNNTTRYIHCNVFAAGSSIYYTNGQVAATGNAGTQFLGNLTFGCASGGGSNGNLEMARLLIYSGILNTNDFQSVNNALNTLYHVAPNLGQ